MPAVQSSSLAPLPQFPRPQTSDACDARWERWIPDWVRHIGTAVWVTAPDGRIVYFNERAERLFGVAARDTIGRPCHGVVASRTATGAAFCSANCPLVTAAGCGSEVEPADVRIGGRMGRAEHWLQMTVIPVDGPPGGPDGPRRWMVHTARVADRARRLEQYVRRIARRSDEIREMDAHAARRPLSPRESDVLELLTRDIEPGRIAAELRLSRVMVRNHIQHLLAKLGAHSVEEAVAMHVLAEA